MYLFNKKTQTAKVAKPMGLSLGILSMAFCMWWQVCRCCLTNTYQKGIIPQVLQAKIIATVN